jgi:hypothetical protein
VRQGSFFYRDADPAKEAAHHRGVGFDPSLGPKAIAQNLKRDVRLLSPRGLQKGPVRHQLGSPMAAVSDRLSRAIPFSSLLELELFRVVRHLNAARVSKYSTSFWFYKVKTTYC